MNKQQLSEQHAFYYDEQQRIPRRSTASPDTRRPQSGVFTRTRQTDEDNVHSSSPMKPMQRRFDHAPLTSDSSERHYVIPMSDGTDIYVTQRKLATMPKAYRQAARQVRPEPAKLQALHRNPRNHIPTTSHANHTAAVFPISIG